MKKLSIFLLILFSLSTSLAYGGEGHGHTHEQTGPISSSEAGNKALDVVMKAVIKEKVPESWAQIKPATIEQKTYDQGPEWVVTFNNTEIENKEKQTLYVFLSLTGHFLAVNFTGN
ncbi:MAG: hypothetical protein GXO96_04260 [Nitrospirae bacterium]|nr:hypothetical protein [Candidatus Manganitrophaceae bacterium]